MIVYLSALKQEHSKIIDQLEDIRPITAGAAWLVEAQFQGQPLLLARTGIGQALAEKAVQFITREIPVQALVFLGFAGALDAKMKGGDLVLADSFSKAVQNPEAGGGQPPSHVIYSDTPLRLLACQALQGLGLAYHIGRSITVVLPCLDAGSRVELADTSGASLVEMEDYWLACLAYGAGLPFLSVRAISDTLEDTLPDFAPFTGARGEIRWGKAVVHFLSHPSQLLVSSRIYRNVKIAQDNLLRFFQAFHPLVSQEVLKWQE